MTSKKPSTVVPIEDFLVKKKIPHHSEYDDEMKRAKDETEALAAYKAVTIDDD